MKQLWIRTISLAATLVFSATFCFAADPAMPAPKDALKTKAAEKKAAVKAEATKAADSKTEAAKAGAAKVADTKATAKTKITDTKTVAKDKAANLKQVDINAATESELKAIPGIGDAYAAKIIAGRPYAKKDQLKSRNILPGPIYDQVQGSIIAKQPAKTAPKK